MTRSSLFVRLARLVQALPLWIFQVVEGPVANILSVSKAPRTIFILALPRSGSTVTYQAVVHGLDVHYLSNVMNLLYQLPLLGGWISRFVSRHHYSVFQSSRGFVGGLDGPAEGLRFWSWWLGSYLSDTEVRQAQSLQLRKRLVYLRAALAVLSKQRPFVTAYLGHTLNPDRLGEDFPEGLFIRLRRDPVENALSILRCMEADEVDWFSVLPEQCEGLEGLSPYERVATQVYWLNRRLDDVAHKHQYFEISYEVLCADPEKEIGRLVERCAARGWSVQRRHALPASLKMSKVGKAGEECLERKAIREALNKIEQSHGRLKKI